LCIHDDPYLEIDQIVARIGEHRQAAPGSGPACCRVGERELLWLRLIGAVALVKGGEILPHRTRIEIRICPVDRLTGIDTMPFAHVGKNLAGIDRKALAANKPGPDRRCTTVSKTCRNASLSRNRP
jgi:hypothetical protein